MATRELRTGEDGGCGVSNSDGQSGRKGGEKIGGQLECVEIKSE